jgi:uncharacterized protein (TIGR03435 family)
MKSQRIGCVVVLTVAIAAFAQTPPPPPLAFEVASIKPAGALDPLAIAQGKVSVGMKVDGAICNIGSFSLRDLVRTAYEVKDYQISGLDSLGAAMSAQRFNIQATLPEGATEKQVPQMLQTLLAERFKLVIHRETRDQPVYALIVAKGGPKLKDAEPDPPAPADAAPATPDAPKKGEAVFGQGANQVRISGNPTDGKGMVVKGGPMGQMHMTMADGKLHLEASKMTMASLADVATNFVGKPVVDMTELKGNYQVALDLSMDDIKNVARAAGMNMPGTPAGNAANAPVDAADPSGSSIFGSVQQLGLKLEARKAPLPYIVVDHFEKMPTEN